jgi:hypothetical protein
MKYSLYILLLCVLLFSGCLKKYETCTDEIKNQTETGIDCGGVCKPCPTCSDGIKNQDETGIDCGGKCNPCASCEDGVKNQGETGIDCGGTACVTCNGADCGLGIDSVSCQFIPSKKVRKYGSYYTNNAFSGDYDVYIDMPLGSNINGIVISFKNISNLLTMSAGTTQHFITTTATHPFDWKINECHFEMNLPFDALTAYSGQHVFVTMTLMGTLDVKFCNIQVQPDQTYYTSMSPVTGNLDCDYKP